MPLTPQIERPHEDFLAVSLSGNISFTTFMKLSTSRKERLCALCSHVRKQSFFNNHRLVISRGGIPEQHMNFLVQFFRKNGIETL